MEHRTPCPTCGAAPDPDASSLGHCPACLFRLALAPEDECEDRDPDPATESGPDAAPDAAPDVADPTRLPAGRRISHYRIVGPLGAGGMGVVYRAVDERLDREVALKLLSVTGAPSAEARARFLREARAASALDHPNVCTIHDVGEDERSGPFLVMARYEGETLAERLERGPLESAEALDLLRQLAAGLRAAHAAGIVHRDLKPRNLLITSDGVLKILDFGLARPAGDPTLTGSGATLGTLAYMAPEQVRGEPVDPRTDLWSLGVVLYEALSGRRPFDGERPATVLHAIVEAEPEPPGIHPAVDRAVLACLAKDPGDRPSRVEEVVAAFTQAVQLVGESAETSEGPVEVGEGTGESDRSSPSRPGHGDTGGSTDEDGGSARLSGRRDRSHPPTGSAPRTERERLRPAVVPVLLATIVAGCLGVAWLEPRVRPEQALTHPPLALAGIAASLLEERGLPGPVDRAFGLQRLPDGGGSSPADRPGAPTGDRLVFWYRQSPEPLGPRGLPFKAADVGRTRPHDPPPVPGSALVVLDGTGDLLGLEIAGAEAGDGEIGIDWERSLRTRRLFGFDARVVAWLLPLGLAIALLVVRATSRSRLAERRAPLSLSSAVFWTLLLSWAVGGGHGPGAVDELRLVIGAAGLAMFYALLGFTLAALAEPLLRGRAAPGRRPDGLPEPGSDAANAAPNGARGGQAGGGAVGTGPARGSAVLVGILAGLGWIAARTLAAFAPGRVAWPLDPPHERLLLGGRLLAGEVLNTATVSLLVGLAFAVALTGLEALSGRPRLAAAAVLVLFGPALAVGEASPLAWPFALLVVATAIGLVRGFGPLAVIAACFVTRLLWLAPLTLDPADWTAPISTTVLALVGLMGLLATRSATALSASPP